MELYWGQTGENGFPRKPTGNMFSYRDLQQYLETPWNQKLRKNVIQESCAPIHCWMWLQYSCSGCCLPATRIPLGPSQLDTAYGENPIKQTPYGEGTSWPFWSSTSICSCLSLANCLSQIAFYQIFGAFTQPQYHTAIFQTQ